MEGVRRPLRPILKYFVALYAVAIVVQIYFAGEGIFGARDNDTVIEDAKTLDLHRGFGFFLAFPFAILLLIAALLGYLASRLWRGEPDPTVSQTAV